VVVAVEKILPDVEQSVFEKDGNASAENRL